MVVSNLSAMNYMEVQMSKDSQVDNKTARAKKSKGQTPLTEENRNQSRNTKKQPVEKNDV